MFNPPKDDRDYYLIKHSNRPKWAKRTGQVQVVIIHCAQSGNLASRKSRKEIAASGGDETNARLASYFASTSRSVSAHACTDSDDILALLPSNVAAYHCRGWNQKSIGIEICADVDMWGKKSTSLDWQHDIVWNTAVCAAHYCVEFDIPVRQINLEEANRGVRGLVSHSTLDSSRRSDPGKNFPWEAFLNMVKTNVESIKEETNPSSVPAKTKKAAPKVAKESKPPASSSSQDGMTALNEKMGIILDRVNEILKKINEV